MHQIARPSHERMPVALLMANNTDRLTEALLTVPLEKSGLNYATLLRPYYAEPELLVFGELGGHAVGLEAILELLIRLVRDNARDNCVGHYIRATEAIPELQETLVGGVYDYIGHVPWAVECVRCGATGHEWAHIRCPVCSSLMTLGHRASITAYFGGEYGYDEFGEHCYVRLHRCSRCQYAVVTRDLAPYNSSHK